MDLSNKSNSDLNDEKNEVVNDSIITTISVDTSSADMSEPVNIATFELSDDIDDDVEIDRPESVIVCSSLNNTNETEFDVSQMDGISNEKVTDESTADIIDENKSLFRLEFENENVFEELATVISSRIREALILLNRTVTVVVDKENHRISFAKADESDIFMVDTLPTDTVHKSEVPSYKSVTEALRKMKKETANDANDKPKSGSCWNCGGDHNMRECKEPMNRENISRGKQLFQRSKTERYHLDAEQKFAHFLPGSISENLREALGLRKRELPLYIYKMRLYGYPPGWLEDAKVTRSGLTLFNAEDSSVPDPTAEEGEVDKVTFDSKQFINYPGFNAAVPDGFIDDTNYYRVPPMQYQHSREGLINALQGNLAKSYKRKKLKLSADCPTIETPTINIQDMDIESDSESASPVVFPLPRPNVDDSSTSADAAKQTPNDDAQSPIGVPENSLEISDLEEQKRKLLQALANANENSNSNSNDFVSVVPADDVTAAGAVAAATAAAEDELALDITVTNEKIDCTEIDRPSTPLVGRSRETVIGTPLLKAVSPFASLPSGDKWSVGVSDVIDFENLPDATGTYQRLRGLINTVRTVVQKINDQNDAEDDDL